MSAVYVSTSGYDTAGRGLSITKPVKTLAKAVSLLQPGWALLLRSGNKWEEFLNIDKAGVRIGAYGTSLTPPRIDGERNRAGILIRTPRVTVDGIHVLRARASGCMVQGPEASASIFRSKFEGCGSGITDGGGDGAAMGIVEHVEDTECIGSDRTMGAGDGFQTNENGTPGLRRLVNFRAIGNTCGGVNIKNGRADLIECVIERNREAGVNIQLHTVSADLLRCWLRDNNQMDNGVAQLTIENGARVYSQGCIYADVHMAAQWSALVNLYNPTMKDGAVVAAPYFHSIDDVFIQYRGNLDKFIAAVLVNSPAPCRAELVRPTFRLKAPASERRTIGNVVEIVEPGTEETVLTLAPQASTVPWETHAAMVHSTERFEGSYAFEVEVRTDKQLRTPTPNPWEWAWVWTDYKPATQQGEGIVDAIGYYFALKPNGWELGKSDTAYPGNQRFLATGENIRALPGVFYKIRMLRDGPSITVFVNDMEVVRFTDTERPYLGGFKAVYTEDAAISARVPELKGSPPQELLEGSIINGWKTEYTGYGAVGIVANE